MDGTGSETRDMLQAATAGTLYGWGNSPFAYKVMMAAAHRGLRLDWCVASLPHCMEAQKRTGKRKTPFVAAADGTWITDSTAICAWLEALPAAGPSLLPADAAARAECLLLEDWSDEGLNKSAEPWIWTANDHFPRVLKLVVDEQTHRPTAFAFTVMSPYMRRLWRGRANVHGGVAGARALLCTQLDMLEARLAGRAWLFGDAPTVADFAIAGQLANLLRFGSSADLDARPATAALVRRACAVLPWMRTASVAKPDAGARS